MTLSISLLTRDWCVTATDRRLTSGSRIITDEHDKTCNIVTEDSRMTISFCGLASCGSFSAHKWLINELTNIAGPDFSIVGISTRLTASLNREFRSNRGIVGLSRSNKRLSIMMSGFRYDQGFCIPIYGVISNFEIPAGKGLAGTISMPEAFDDFQLLTGSMRSDQNCVTVGIGDISNVKAAQVSLLRNKAPSLTPRAATLKLINIIRGATFVNRGISTIGRQITTSLIFMDPSKPTQTDYHAHSVNRAGYMPAMVFALRNSVSAVSSIKIEPVEKTTPPISVPLVKKNRPCPCGSGKKYKACHGKRS